MVLVCLPAVAQAQAAVDCDVEDCPATAVDSSQPPPPGFHYETQTSVPLLVGGIALSTVGTVVLASGIANAAEASDSERDGEGASDGAVIAAGGVTLAAGVGLIVWSMIGGPKVLARNRAVSFEPSFQPGRAGGELTLTF